MDHGLQDRKVTLRELQKLCCFFRLFYFQLIDNTKYLLGSSLLKN